MKASLALLREANDFLDTIGESRKFDAVNIVRIDTFRQDMLDLGFNAPFTALLKMTAEEMQEMEDSEFEDAKKQMRNIKYIANLKKATLRRMRVALASHKIAQSALSRKRDDLVPYLPLDGNHISIMAKTSEAGLNAHLAIMKAIVEAEKGFRAIVEVEAEVEGKKVTRQVRLLEGEKMEERIKREFGEEAKVKDVKIVKASSPIIKNKSSRLAIITAEVARACDIAKKKLDEEEKKDALMKEYNAILSAEKLEKDVRIDLVSGFEKLKAKLIEKKLARKEKGVYVLEDSLGTEIRRRRMLREQIVLDEAAKSMMTDMLKFYVKNAKAERESSAIYPTLASEPTGEQLSVFGLLEELIEVKNLSAILSKKFAYEKLGLRMKSAPFGAAVFSRESKKNASWCAEFFGVDEKEISEALEKLDSSIGNGANIGVGKAAKDNKETRGTEFLDKLKKKGK